VDVLIFRQANSTGPRKEGERTHLRVPDPTSKILSTPSHDTHASWYPSLEKATELMATPSHTFHLTTRRCEEASSEDPLPLDPFLGVAGVESDPLPSEEPETETEPAPVSVLLRLREEKKEDPPEVEVATLLELFSCATAASSSTSGVAGVL